MSEYRGLVLHIMQGSYDGSIAWGKNPASDVSFHFAARGDGHLGQLVDTADTAWTQSNGNGHWISVENEGYSGNPLAPGQVEAVAQLYARGVREHGWPLQLADSATDRGLGWHGMGGTAWGGHPDCLPLDITEVLTEQGWVWLRDVEEMDRIASVSMDSGLLTFDRPIGIVKPYESRTVKVAGFEMTPEHRLYVHRSDAKSRKVIAAAEVGNARTNWLIPCFGDTASPASIAMDNDLLRLLVWVQADGHYENDGGTQPILHFHVTKRRKSERIVEILNALGVAHKYVVRRDGTVSVRVRMREWLRENVRSWLPDKTWEPWILQLNSAQFTVLDHELTQADGSEHGGQRFYFSSIKKNVDLIQALYVTHGRAASVYKSETEQYGATHVLNLHTRRKALALRDSYRESRPSALVGCLTTVNDTILIRQAGRVAVVGNCPGEPIKAQRQQILNRTAQILGGQPNLEDDMTPEQDNILKATDQRLWQSLILGNEHYLDSPGTEADQSVWIVQAMKDIQAKLAAPVPVVVDAAAVAAALAVDPTFLEALTNAAFAGAQRAERE